MKRLIAAVERMLGPHDLPKANTYDYWKAYYRELRIALEEAKQELAAPRDSGTGEGG